MRRSLSLPAAALILLTALAPDAGLSRSLEDSLRLDIEDGRLDAFSKIEAAFILSGVEDPDSLKACVDWHRGIVRTIEEYRFPMTDRAGSARRVFAWLHGAWLVRYDAAATTLTDVRDRKTYNCVSGTILFNLTCEALGWSTDAFETPTHVYTFFNNYTERIPIENTSPMGFDIMKNLGEYSRFLLQYYPGNRAARIGLDRLFAYENGKGREINNTELLGLLAYNRAFFARKDSSYERAWDYVLLARRFNRDSRSNVDFEIGLTFERGSVLLKRGENRTAFETYAEGFRRFPDIGDLRLNARAAFFRFLQAPQPWDSIRPALDTALDLPAWNRGDLPFLQRRLAGLHASAPDRAVAEEIRAYIEALPGLAEELKD
ncbi:MAG: hypothetical protein QUS35_10570 [bacterium]|nr:hypothetical protein [bacterium]